MADKEIIFEIEKGKIDVVLGEGWPEGSEAANEANAWLKGFAEVTIKSHRPHTHNKEHNENTVTA